MQTRQPALDGIKDHQHPGMADVAVVIDGHAADVHARLAGFNGNKDLFFPGKGIVDFEHKGTRGGVAAQRGEY